MLLTILLAMHFFSHLALFLAPVLRPPRCCLALTTSSWAINLRRLALLAKRCGCRCNLYWPSLHWLPQRAHMRAGPMFSSGNWTLWRANLRLVLLWKQRFTIIIITIKSSALHIV